MDVLKLLQDCIETFNLDANNLRDIAFAICTADKMNGTNKRELDIDKFVESDTELSWDSILAILGVEPQSKGYTKLPRVQKLRVISDVLSLSLSDKVDGLVLSCNASKKVSKLLGVSLSSEDYADEDEKPLRALSVSTSASVASGVRFEALTTKPALWFFTRRTMSASSSMLCEP